MTVAFKTSGNVLRACMLGAMLLGCMLHANAQTYSSACGIAANIPDNSCARIPLRHNITVSGTAGTQLGVNVMLASVSIIIEHSFDGEVEAYLESPGGVSITLTSGNGSFGVNYGNPLDTTCASVTNFSRNGIDGPVAGGSAPFIGNYVPEGNLDDFNDGSDPNGIWKLFVCDNFPGDSGTVQYVSLTFAAPCDTPMVNSISTTSSSAALGWTSSNAGASYTIEYGIPGFSPGGIGSLGMETGTSVAGGNQETIGSLSAFTAYDFYLSENCGALQSIVSGPFSFTTNKANDDCSGALAIACGDLIVDSTSAGATSSDAPDVCGTTQNDAPGLWYVFAGNGLDVTVTTCGLAGYDTKLGVYEGPCSDLTCISGNDNFCAPQSEVTFTSTAGKNYYIYVSGGNAETGVFQLSVSCAASLVINEMDYAQPGIDSSEFIEIKNTGAVSVNLSAIDLLLVNGTGGGAALYDTIALPAVNLAPNQYFVVCGNASKVSNCNMDLSATEWLRDGSPDAVALSVAGTLIDAVSYNGNTGIPYIEGAGVGLEDDSTVANFGISRLPDGADTDVNNADFSQRCISPGVSNISQNSGCTVSNDSCAHALVIQPALGIPFDNRGATTDGISDFCDSIATGSDQIYSDIWYSFTPACDGIATVSTVGGTLYDTRIQVYLAPCSGATIDCNDDSTGIIVQSSVTWAATSGIEYLIRLGGFSHVLQGFGTFDLTLVEATPPLITCGADKFKNTQQGICTATVNPPAPAASDNCSAVDIVNDYNFTSNALGNYPVGTTQIIWTTTDASGNTATCLQQVTVTDAENPTITCPPDYTQTTDSGICTAAVTVVSPATADNCSVSTVINDFNGTASGTDNYPVGTHTVIWTVTDVNSNTSTCSHTIIVTDNEKPTLICPLDITIASCGSVAVIPVPANGDNCSVDSLINDFNGLQDASGVYPVGVTMVEWTVTDVNGNTNTCSITVTRNTPPSASVTPDPAEACVFADLILHGNPVAGTGAIASHTWAGPVVGAVNRDSVTFNFGVPGFSAMVTYTVTDSNGCTATDNVSVTVFDKPDANVIPDVIEACQGDTIQLNGNPAGGNGAFVTHLWTGDISPLSSASVVNPDFSTSVPGNYNLTYRVTDTKNCKGSDNVLVIVNQNPSVNITPAPARVCLNTPLTLNANLVAGSGGIIAQGWTGNTSPLSSTTNSVSDFNTSAPGVFNLVFSATDNNLCAAADSIIVTVDSLPVVSFTGLQTEYCESAPADVLTGAPANGTFSGPGVGGLPVTSNYAAGPDTILSSNINISTQMVSVPGDTLGVNVMLKKVCFKVKHTFLSDLDIFLESPLGNSVLLTTAPCTSLDDLDVCIEPGTGNSMDVAACSATPPALTGTFTASVGDNLANLNDSVTNPNGNWNLVIVDNVNSADGSLIDWSLEFEYMGAVAFNPAAAGPGNHVVTYTFMDGNGCVNSETQNVTVHPAVIADAGTDATICEGTDATLTATGGSNYSWSTGALTAAISVFPAATTNYEVTVSSPFGCADKDDVTVFVNPLPVSSFTGLDTAYCPDAILDTLAGTPSGGTFTGAGLNTSGTGLATVSYTGDTVAIPSETIVEIYDTASGIVGTALGVDVALESVCFKIDHTFVQDLIVVLYSPSGNSVTLTAQPCADNDNLDVCIEQGTGNSMDNALCNVVPPALSGTFTASSDAGDDLAALNDGTTNPNGVWTLEVSDVSAGDDGNIIDFSLNFNSFGITTFNPATAGTGTHTIVYSFTDNNGCTSTDSASTIVYAAPAALAQPDTAICPGGNVSLTATGGIAYSWSTGSSSDSINVAPDSTSVYTVSVTDGNGCSSSDDVTVAVFAAPVVNAGANQTVCAGALTVLQATGGVNYQWSTGDSTAFILVAPVTATTYSVTATDGNGCTGSDSATVSVNALPLASPGPDEGICLGDTVDITATGGINYYWSDGVNTVGSGTRPAAPLSTTVYSVTVEDTNGCTDDTTVTVTVYSLPVAKISGLNTVYCNNNNPVTLTGTPAGGAFAGPAISGDVFSPALLTPGNYEIAYLYMDSFGCADSDTADVFIMNAPAISFTGLAPAYCPDTIAHLLTGIPPGGTFSGAGISSSTGTFVSYFAGSGTHDIVYTYFQMGICPGRDTQSVVVYSLPDARILDLDSAYCSADEPDTLTGFPAGGVFSGAEMVGDVFYPQQVVTGNPAVVYYEYFDSNGCPGFATKTTTVYPNPAPVVVNPGDLCVNGGLTLLSAAPSGGSFTGPGASGNVLATGVAGAGTHEYVYAVTSPHGCAGDTSVFITIHDVGAVSFTGLDTDYCVNEPVAVLTGNPAGGLFTGPGVAGNTFAPAGAGTGGPFDVMYAYTDSNNCTVKDTQSVTVLNAPFAQIGGLAPLYCVYDAPVPISLFPTGGELTGPALSNNTFDPHAAGVGTHVISYKVMNNEGCSEIETTIVVVDACVGMTPTPAAASVHVYPNPTDGRFVVEISGRVEAQTQVRLYDLTGKMLFEERVTDTLAEYHKEFDLSAFAKGVYYLRINFADGVVVKKVAVE